MGDAANLYGCITVVSFSFHGNIPKLLV